MKRVRPPPNSHSAARPPHLSPTNFSRSRAPSTDLSALIDEPSAGGRDPVRISLVVRMIAFSAFFFFAFALTQSLHIDCFVIMISCVLHPLDGSVK